MFTPPTDSLYKFFAIAGLVMILWGAAFPWNKSYEAKLQAAQLRSQINAVGQNAEQLQAQYDYLTRALQALAPSPANETERQEIRTQKRELHISLIKAQNPVDTGIEKLRVVDEAVKTYRQIGWASIILGVFFMLSGFTAWYYKIQRYIDRDIKEGSSKEPQT